MPENTVYVGRGSKWGNPFIVGEHGMAKECAERFALRSPGTRKLALSR